MYDIKIINGNVIDFEGNTLKTADIGIVDGKISTIGNCPESAKVVIDAEGKVVSPGFIDIHMHEEEIDASKANATYDISNSMLMMGVTTCVAGNCGNNRQSMEDFIQFISNHGAPVNYLSFIGHNYLRNAVGNTDRYKKSTKENLKNMRNLVKAALDSGAIGISFGLEYSPGVDFEEVVDLCKDIDKNILLSAHFRKDAKHCIDSLNELIDISKVTGFPMQISHLGSCAAYGMMKESLQLIQSSINAGIDVLADCYPYDAFSTFIGSAVFDEGCFQLWNKSYDSILLTEGDYKGLRCNEELFHKVRKQHPNMLVVAFVMNENEVVEALKAPFVMVASDGIFRDGQGHPRAAGTFPRVLGKYVRETRQLTLVEAVKKMTLMPANRLGLHTKGVLKEGYDADIVIFEADTIIDKATYEAPKNPPLGINYVIINGEIAYKDGNIVRNDLGRFLRGQDK